MFELTKENRLAKAELKLAIIKEIVNGDKISAYDKLPFIKLVLDCADASVFVTKDTAAVAPAESECGDFVKVES